MTFTKALCLMAFSNLSDCVDTEKNSVCVDNHKAKTSSRLTLTCKTALYFKESSLHLRRDSSVHLLSVWAVGLISFTWFSPAPTSKRNIRMCTDVNIFRILLLTFVFLVFVNAVVPTVHSCTLSIVLESMLLGYLGF